MSKLKLNVATSVAKERLEAQAEKGGEVGKFGSEATEGKTRYEIPTRVRDRFVVMYKLWRKSTEQVLRDIFVSSTYAYEFKEQHSSRVQYVSSDWVPDIEYYLGSQLIQKLDYLANLLVNINDFEEPTEDGQTEEESSKSQTTPKIAEAGRIPSAESFERYDAGKLTLSGLAGSLTIPQVWKLSAIIVAILSAVFSAGFKANSWLEDRNANEAFLEVRRLEYAIERMSAKLDYLIGLGDQELDTLNSAKAPE